MPLSDKVAARANRMREAWIERSINELHHIAMSHAIVQIRKLCMPRSYRFADLGPVWVSYYQSHYLSNLIHPAEADIFECTPR